MKTTPINNAQQSFKAKVSPTFISSMQRFINSNENRLKNNYRLTKKIEECAKYGYDDYTIEMQQKIRAYGNEYRILAVKDGDDISNGILLMQNPCYSFRIMYERFMNLNKHKFKYIMKRHVQ